jgi:hypothetical protein
MMIHNAYLEKRTRTSVKPGNLRLNRLGSLEFEALAWRWLGWACTGLANMRLSDYHVSTTPAQARVVIWLVYVLSV